MPYPLSYEGAKLITCQHITQYGPEEAAARQANHNGWAVATHDAMDLLFGVGAAEGAYQTIQHEGSTITVCTSTMGHPPQAFAP